ncbi:MAG: ferrous iron transport protein A [Saprospiraceae bacterium]|nr:ferrous iron transport protein A [Saprospiraceae bacterium]
MRVISLPEFATRQSGVIDRFTDDRLAVKMMSMGVFPGRTIELVRKTSFGDTLYVLVDKRALAIRKKEASCILLK